MTEKIGRINDLKRYQKEYFNVSLIHLWAELTPTGGKPAPIIETPIWIWDRVKTILTVTLVSGQVLAHVWPTQTILDNHLNIPTIITEFNESVAPPSLPFNTWQHSLTSRYTYISDCDTVIRKIEENNRSGKR